jgi:hypothetical protein
MPEPREAKLVGGLRDGVTVELKYLSKEIVCAGSWEERGQATYDGERWVTTFPKEIYKFESRDPWVFRYSHTVPAAEGDLSGEQMEDSDA